MISITNGCRWKSDVVDKKKQFESKIAKLGIHHEEKQDYYRNPKYNIESESTLTSLRDAFGRENDEDRLADVLKIFTKINVLRKGESKVPVDCVGSIFLTENGRTKAIAFSDPIYPNDGSIPFATDIEFLTERIWFKLNKGFGKNGSLPTSFDVITKAKLVLSSQLNRSVSDTYRELSKKYEKGEIDKDRAALLVSELRSRPNKPDDMTEAAAEQSIAFIENDLMERVQREKALLERKAQDGEIAIRELKYFKYIFHKNLLRPLKRRVRFLYCSLVILFSLALSVASFLIIQAFYGDNDTLLSVSLSAIPLFISAFSFFKIRFLSTKLRRFCTHRYRLSLNKALRRSNR